MVGFHQRIMMFPQKKERKANYFVNVLEIYYM